MLKTRRSGGPKTVLGKQIASQNALKTGAYSATVVLPGEDQAEFQELVNQFVRNFAPQDAAEVLIVHELADLSWRLLRFKRVERTVLLRQLDAPISSDDFLAEGVVPIKGSEWILDKIGVVGPVFMSAMLGYDEIRRSIDELTSTKLTAEVVKTIPFKHHALFRQVIVLYIAYFPFDGAVLESIFRGNELVDRRIHAEGCSEERFIDFALRTLSETADQVLWVQRNLDQIEQAIAGIKDQRLAQLMQAEGPARVNDYLSRAYFRTLVGLRHHQTWRREMGTVDVTPRCE